MREDLARLAPRDFPLTVEMWRASAKLAALRVAVNDPTRRPNRDGGTEKNILNDAIGALSELVALHALAEAGAIDLSHSLLDLYEPVDKVDVRGRFPDSADGPFNLEVKGHFQDSHKTRFLINAKAQARSRARGADGHLPVVTSRLHSFARIGRVIPITDVEQPPWGAPTNFSRTRDDPSLWLYLKQFTPIYLAGTLLRPGPKVPLSEDELDQAYEQGRRSLQRLRADQFSLDNLVPDEIIARLDDL